MNNISISDIISIVSLIVAIISFFNIRSINIRQRKVTTLTSVAIDNISKMLKEINNSKISNEIERNVRRIALYTKKEDLINNSLRWFIEKGNPDDKADIEEAYHYRCFRSKLSRTLAQEAMFKITERNNH